MARYDLTSLKLFVTACRHGSITASARINNITPSAVSKRLADLEAVAGESLLRRSKQGVEPTEAGEVMMRYAQAISRMTERLDLALEEFHMGVTGQVRIAANISIITQFLPQALARFLVPYPNIRFELQELSSKNVVAAVIDGAVDVGLCSDFVNHRGLQKQAYRTDKLMVLAPGGHPLAGQKQVSFKQVLKYDQVALWGDSSLQAFLREHAEKLGKTLKVCVEVMSFDGVRNMIEAGLGIGVLPDGAILPYLETRDLVAVPLEESWATRELVMVARDFRGQSKAAQLFITQLLSEECPA